MNRSSHPARDARSRARGSLTRRDALRIASGGAAALALGACSRRDDSPRVVLYSSVDDVYLREIAAAYERDSGVRVDVVGDTEATKSTGLAERVIAERARPRADVWWSSEPFFTIRLAREGLLEPGAARAALGGGVADRWPSGMMGADGSWVGFAARARVIVYRASRFGDGGDRFGAVPRTLGALADPAFRGRVAMARPEFGTTRGHLAALIELEGAAAVEAWLRAMKANALRVYPGNSSVVRAVAQGEADLGLTDTDDVWAGQRNGWDVAAAFEEAEPAGLPSGPTPGSGPDAGLRSRGPLVLPNTAGLVRAGPNPEHGRRLLAWILAGHAERLLAASESRNYPVHPDVADVGIEPALPATAWRPDLEGVADHLDEAASLAARVIDG
ncbi:MAG: extracellular solute-binding protein [Phycisphaerales bacterium]|nr:extracellular solute-binding protein [Phycisphaerales bacterium]